MHELPNEWTMWPPPRLRRGVHTVLSENSRPHQTLLHVDLIIDHFLCSPGVNGDPLVPCTPGGTAPSTFNSTPCGFRGCRLEVCRPAKSKGHVILHMATLAHRRSPALAY